MGNLSCKTSIIIIEKFLYYELEIDRRWVYRSRTEAEVLDIPSTEAEAVICRSPKLAIMIHKPNQSDKAKLNCMLKPYLKPKKSFSDLKSLIYPLLIIEK